MIKWFNVSSQLVHSALHWLLTGLQSLSRPHHGYLQPGVKPHSNLLSIWVGGRGGEFKMSEIQWKPALRDSSPCTQISALLLNPRSVWFARLQQLNFPLDSSYLTSRKCVVRIRRKWFTSKDMFIIFQACLKTIIWYPYEHWQLFLAVIILALPKMHKWVMEDKILSACFVQNAFSSSETHLMGKLVQEKIPLQKNRKRVDHTVKMQRITWITC